MKGIVKCIARSFRIMIDNFDWELDKYKVRNKAYCNLLKTVHTNTRFVWKTDFCVLMIYCGLNNNKFKLFLREHRVKELCGSFNGLFHFLVIKELNYFIMLYPVIVLKFCGII